MSHSSKTLFSISKTSKMFLYFSNRDLLYSPGNYIHYLIIFYILEKNLKKETCVCVTMLVIQSCWTVCDPLSSSPPNPLSMEFSWQVWEWVRHSPSPGIFPTQGQAWISCMEGTNSLPSEQQGRNRCF